MYNTCLLKTVYPLRRNLETCHSFLSILFTFCWRFQQIYRPSLSKGMNLLMQILDKLLQVSACELFEIMLNTFKRQSYSMYSCVSFQLIICLNVLPISHLKRRHLFMLIVFFLSFSHDRLDKK